MENISVSRRQIEPILGFPGRILVVQRSTGEVIDAPGGGCESDESVARAFAIIVAVLSSIGLGGELRRVEVEYAAGRATILVDRDVVRVSIED